ncbi:MAG: hypothetical protein Q8L46_01335, partial [candidate division WWE3 bacterium]|nr:hypothetical protein [candidate division WWE3 bacterium]
MEQHRNLKLVLSRFLRDKVLKHSKRFLLLAAIGALASVALFIWRRDMPYPNIAGWDIFAHQTLFNEIQRGKLSLFPSQISDTFLVTSYFPTFAVLVGVVGKALSFLSFAQTYFVLDTIHFLATVALSAYAGWAATQRRLGALAAGAFGAFIFETTVVQTSLFLTPQSLAAVLGILGVIFLLNKKNKAAAGFLSLSFLFHFVIGAGAIALAGATLLFQSLVGKEKGRGLVFALGLGALLAGILTNFLPFNLNPLQTAESREFNFTLAQKWELVQNWYGFLWVFYLAGVWAALKKRQPRLDVVLALSLCSLAAVALFAPYALKFYTLARFLVHAVAAGGVLYLLDGLRPMGRYALLALLVCIQITVFNVNQKNFKEAFAYQDTFTSASYDEIEAADYLRRNYGPKEGFLLVSDPATQHIFEALSTVNTQGGSFATPETRQAV